MSQFLGTHQNRLDAKGRVSIPAQFRAILRAGIEADEPITVILRPSHKHPCVEGWPKARFDALSAGVSQLNQFSDAHEDMATALYADAYPVEPDKEGRIALNDELIAHAGLNGQVSFMGIGGIFQIWDPAISTKRRLQAREAAKLRDLSLPGGMA